MADPIDVMMARMYYRLVSTWRRMAELVAKAAKSLYPEAQVYVTGSAAEGKLTALSDVDVVLVLPYDPDPRERLEVKLRVMEEAFRLGLPLDYPIDLHVIGPSLYQHYKKLARMIRLA